MKRTTKPVQSRAMGAAGGLPELGGGKMPVYLYSEIALAGCLGPLITKGGPCLVSSRHSRIFIHVILRRFQTCNQFQLNPDSFSGFETCLISTKFSVSAFLASLLSFTYCFIFLPVSKILVQYCPQMSVLRF